MKILGLSGTNGAGKDTLANVLEEHGWFFVSVTDILRDELRRQNQPIERENLRNLSAQWRREHGLGVLIDKAVAEFKKQRKQYRGLVVSSLRNSGEADAVHALKGKVVWLDADPHIRYERIFSRNRGDEDNKTFEEFLAEERTEMQHTGDDATLNMSGVKDRADIFIQNDTHNIEDFRTQVEQLNL